MVTTTGGDERYHRLAGGVFRTDEVLLLVRRNGFAETYRRLYFRDLEGLQIEVTPRRRSLNLAFGLMAGMLVALGAGLLGIAVGFRLDLLYPVVVGLLVPLAAVFALMAGNTWLGPGCRCLAHTAVQTVTLPGIDRLRQAQALVAELAPRVARSQGDMAPEEFARRLAAAWAPLVSPAAAPSPPAAAPSPPAVAATAPPTAPPAAPPTAPTAPESPG